MGRSRYCIHVKFSDSDSLIVFRKHTQQYSEEAGDNVSNGSEKVQEKVCACVKYVTKQTAQNMNTWPWTTGRRASLTPHVHGRFSVSVKL